MNESTGYKQKCEDCGDIWPYSTDYCPNCASENFNDFHLMECECEECKKSNK